MYYLLFLVALTVNAQAQLTLTGTVKSATGGPLIGSSMLVKNRSTGTTVDAGGTYRELGASGVIYTLKLIPKIISKLNIGSPCEGLNASTLLTQTKNKTI